MVGTFFAEGRCLSTQVPGPSGIDDLCQFQHIAGGADHGPQSLHIADAYGSHPCSPAESSQGWDVADIGKKINKSDAWPDPRCCDGRVGTGEQLGSTDPGGTGHAVVSD